AATICWWRSRASGRSARETAEARARRCASRHSESSRHRALLPRGGARRSLPQLAPKVRPNVAQVDRERDPPDQVVRQAQNHRAKRPRAAQQQHAEADGAEDLAEKSDRGEDESALWHARDLPVDEA